MRPVFLVGALVCRQRRLVREAFAAVTHVHSLLLVRLDVAVQGTRAVEHQLTTRAGKAVGLPYRTIHPDMADIGAPPCEGFTTSAAEVRTVLHVRT